MSIKLVYLNVVGAVLALASFYWEVLPFNLFEGVNLPYLAIMVGVFLSALLFAVTSRTRRAERLSNRLIDLGLLGTVIGIMIAVGGVQGGEVELRDLGIGTALKTTAFGVVGYLWVWLNLWTQGLGNE